MTDRLRMRLLHIRDAVEQINALAEGRTLDGLLQDRVALAAFERFLEIISESSRHIPDDVKAAYPAIAWPKVAHLGNHLRHVYHRTDHRLLWSIYEEGELRILSGVVEELLVLPRTP